MSHSLCVMGMYDEVKMTVPMIVRYVHNDKIREKRNMKRTRQTEHPEVTKMMEIWVKTALQQKVTLTGELLRQKWAVFADAANVPVEDRLNLSNGWLARFKIRLGLKEYKYHGEAGSADLGDVEREQQRIWQFVAEHGYAHRDIFNMDEMGLFYA
jgi:hypothetical protein